MSGFLRRMRAEDVVRARASRALPDARIVAQEILADVQREGRPAVERYARRFGELEDGASILVPEEALAAARAQLAPELEACLLRTRARIARFAEAQRASLQAVELSLDGGYRASQRLSPVSSAGCYVPGGRFPLVSSLLMTTTPARVAGVPRIVVASPRPSAEMLAAASIAGVDTFLAIGGAHAIGVLAYGCDVLEPVDFVCGPGNAYVTAAKQLVFGDVGVDMLAGPSELTVVADARSDARLVAFDMLAQAEHDVDARAVLVTTSRGFVEEVERALADGLASLPRPETARAALAAHGCAIVCDDREAVVRVCDELAPEHLELLVDMPPERFRNYGALFVGARAGEVLGDYGVGPNHVLPTASSARARGGLSVFDFLRVPTCLDGRGDPGAARAREEELLADVAMLARIEGLEAHARAAELRGAAGRS